MFSGGVVITQVAIVPVLVVTFVYFRKLYWTDRGYPPKIESSNLDGSNRKEIVKDDIIWPNGVAVDYPNGRLYWTDTKKRTIETVDLYGKDRYTVVKFGKFC